MASKQQFTIFIGNLRKNIRISLLKQNLVVLLQEIGITVAKFDIDVRKGHSTHYAFVNLDNEMDLKHAIHTLSAAECLKLKKINLEDVVAEDMVLLVANKKDKIVKDLKDRENEQSLKDCREASSKLVSRESNLANTPRVMSPFEKSPPMGRQKRARRKSRDPDVHLSKTWDLSSDSEKEEKPKGPSRPNFSIVSPYDQENRADVWRKNQSENSSEDETLAAKNQTYQKQWLDELNDSENLDNPRKTSQDTTSSLDPSAQFAYQKALIKKYPYEHFKVGEHVGKEDRETEFKEGGGIVYLKKKLKEHTGKYMVSFLNSNGGTLMVGVDDDGRVVGVKCNQKQEDKARVSIDNAIKGIRPSVFPSMYKVSFVPVISNNNENHGDLKVIQITVENCVSPHLFETKKGHVYIRREGSIQGPLKAREIQEWTEVRYRLEERRKEQEITNLRRLEEELRGQLAQRDDKEKELSETLARLEMEYKQSKVCTIL